MEGWGKNCIHFRRVSLFGFILIYLEMLQNGLLKSDLNLSFSNPGRWLNKKLYFLHVSGARSTLQRQILLYLNRKNIYYAKLGWVRSGWEVERKVKAIQAS